ncbi:MAG: sensor domain-containing diguanylate cyclase [Candidatus Omnitrophota bacterium]
MQKFLIVLLAVGIIFIIAFLFIKPLMGGALLLVSGPFLAAAIYLKINASKVEEELKAVVASFQNEKEEIIQEIRRKEKRQREQFAQLRNFGKDLASAINKDQLLRLIVNMFSKITADMSGDSQCFLLCQDPGTDEFDYVTGCNFDRSMLKALRYKQSDELLKKVMLTKKIFTDRGDAFGNDAATSYFLKGERPAYLARLSALALIPLVLEDEVWGIIVVFCGESAAMRIKNEEEFFLLLVSEGAIALGSAIHRGLASVDRLTQLYNRTFLQKRINEELEFCNRQLLPMSLLMIDIDYFKNINDTYGHQDGDMVLKKIAQILSQSIRMTDICARYGGEEFVVVLPGLAEKEGDQFSIAERLRLSVEKEDFIMQGDKHIKLTISVGVVVRKFPEDKAMGMDQLIQKADEMLYKAKHEGRNRVCYPEPEEFHVQ